MRNGKKFVSLLLAGVLAVLSCSCGNSSKEENSKKEADSNPRTEMRDDMTTSQIVEEMGLGINLGNTLEACGDWIDSSGGVNSYETAWGSPTITEDMIAGYAAAGFDSVRQRTTPLHRNC